MSVADGQSPEERKSLVLIFDVCSPPCIVSRNFVLHFVYNLDKAFFVNTAVISTDYTVLIKTVILN